MEVVGYIEKDFKMDKEMRRYAS